MLFEFLFFENYSRSLKCPLQRDTLTLTHSIYHQTGTTHGQKVNDTYNGNHGYNDNTLALRRVDFEDAKMHCKMTTRMQ